MPTDVYQVGASSDDASERASGGLYDHVNGSLFAYASTSDITRYHVGLRLTSVSLLPGSEVADAYVSLKTYHSTRDDADMTIYGEAAANPVTFSSITGPITRTKTTAGTLWQESNMGAGWQDSPGIAAVVQEIRDDHGFQDGNAMVLILWCGNLSSDQLLARAYDFAAADAPKLTITHLPPAAMPHAFPHSPTGQHAHPQLEVVAT